MGKVTFDIAVKRITSLASRYRKLNTVLTHIHQIKMDYDYDNPGHSLAVSYSGIPNDPIRVGISTGHGMASNVVYIPFNGSRSCPTTSTVLGKAW